MSDCEDPITRYDPSGRCPPAGSTSISLSFTSDGGGAGREGETHQAGGGRGGGEGGLFGVISRGIRSRVILLLFHWSD